MDKRRSSVCFFTLEVSTCLCRVRCPCWIPCYILPSPSQNFSVLSSYIVLQSLHSVLLLGRPNEGGIEAIKLGLTLLLGGEEARCTSVNHKRDYSAHGNFLLISAYQPGMPIHIHNFQKHWLAASPSHWKTYAIITEFNNQQHRNCTSLNAHNRNTY